MALEECVPFCVSGRAERCAAAELSPRSAAGGLMPKIFAEEVTPGDDAFEVPGCCDDGEAGHAMLKQQSRRCFHGRVGCDRDEFPAHDLMGAFVERCPVAIGFGQCPDIGTHRLEQIAI